MTAVTPTYCLKSITPADVIARYHQGEFNREYRPKSRITLQRTVPVLAPIYGVSNFDPIYTLKGPNNEAIVIATTNHEAFSRYQTNGEQPVAGNHFCLGCRKQYYGIPLGIPVAFNDQTILETLPDGRQINRNHYTFWMEGQDFHSTQCLYTYLNQLLNKVSTERDPRNANSLTYLSFLHRLMHPGVPLVPLNDPKLLLEHGGSLSRKEWEDQDYIYVPKPRVHLVPVKLDYVKTRND